jgi:hypothetical protein
MHLEMRGWKRPIAVVILAGVLQWTACTGGIKPQPAAAVPPPPSVPAVAASSEKNQRVTQMLDLLTSLAAYNRNGRNRQQQQISFEIPETEINEYLAYSLRFVRRPGIESASVTLLPHNTVQAVALIDYDAIRRWNPGTVPLALQATLQGKREIHLDAQFEAQNGILNFTLQAAQDHERKPIPKDVAANILRSLAAQQPEQYDTSAPIRLPFGLQRVWTESRVLCGNT